MVGSDDTTDNATLTWLLANTSCRQEDEGADVQADDRSVVGPVLTGLVLSVIVLCTIVGNVMVLLAVFVNSHLRSTTNYFIVNLAIADLLLGTTVLPFSASLEVSKVWLFGQVLCDIWAAIDVLCCTASIFSLCVISIDRYIGVTRPLQRSTIMTERRAVYIIVFIWLLSMAISIAPLIGWKEPPSQDPYECTVTTQTGYVLFSASGSFYIPLLIILLVYFRIYREAIKHSRFLSTGVKTTKVDESGVTLRVHKGGGGAPTSLCATNNDASHGATSPSPTPRKSGSRESPGHQSSSSSDRSENSVGNKTSGRLTAAGKVARFKRETKAAKTLGIVVGVFILCWFPFFFILPLGSLCRHCNIPQLLFTIFFWLGYCNSLMNPIIYACSSREFQFAFRRILRCQFRRRPRVFLTDQADRYSSCHDFNQLEPATSSNAGRSCKSRRHPASSSTSVKARKDSKFVRTFRSNTLRCARSSRNGLSGGGGATCLRGSLCLEADIPLTESPESARAALQRSAENSRRDCVVSGLSDARTRCDYSDWLSPSGNGLATDEMPDR